MRKLIPAALLISGFLLLSTPAHAEENDPNSSTVQDLEQEQGLSNSPKDKKHQEIEQKYGKKGKLSFPPLVIRPMRPSDAAREPEPLLAEQAETSAASAGTAEFIAVNPALKVEANSVMEGTAVFPERNIPIDISNVKLTRRTPADVFIQASQFGLSLMAAGALALTAVAASRAIRRK